MAKQEDDTLKATGAVLVTKDELTAAFAGPAVFSNKMYLTLTPVTGRLSFVEVPPGGAPQFRAAVCLTINDLLELRDLLDRMLEGKVKPIDMQKDDSDG